MERAPLAHFVTHSVCVMRVSTWVEWSSISFSAWALFFHESVIWLLEQDMAIFEPRCWHLTADHVHASDAVRCCELNLVRARSELSVGSHGGTRKRHALHSALPQLVAQRAVSWFIFIKTRHKKASSVLVFGSSDAPQILLQWRNGGHWSVSPVSTARRKLLCLWLKIASKASGVE